MKEFSTIITRNRSLIGQFVKRETIAKYKGSFLGIFWSIVTPILMIVVYTFVFSQIFNAKWGAEYSSNLDFALMAYCGLATFSIFSEVVSRAPSLILSNVNYVKKVIFPLDIFSIISIGTALVTAAINYGLVILFELVYKHSVPWTAILLPIVILPMLFLIAGLSWFLSSIGVFIRDIGHAMGIIIQALMLLSPIFYPAEVVPEAFRWFYSINPINYYIENVRNVLILGQIPNPYTFLLQLVIALILMYAGWLWFKKTKSSFADVM